MSPGQSCRIIGDRLGLVFVYNTHAVFGLDPRAVIHNLPVNLFFSLFMAIAAVVLVGYYRFLKKSDRLMHWSIMFILPGALGNLYDRVAHGALGVVDFIKLDLGIWPFNPWPIFNMADLWVTIGLVLMVTAFFSGKERQDEAPEAGAQPPAPPVTSHDPG